MAWNEKVLKKAAKKVRLDKFDLEAEREAEAMRKVKEMTPKKVHIDGRVDYL